MERLLVILDLDETLVHVPDWPLGRRADFHVLGHPGYRRPHLEAFLSELRDRYEVAVWTAARRDYAEEVVAAICPWRSELAFVWSGEDCVEHLDGEGGGWSAVKDVRRVRERGYDLGRVVMVDDSPEKHLHGRENLIPIAPFLGDGADAELPAVAALLRSLSAEPDVCVASRRLRRG